MDEVDDVDAFDNFQVFRQRPVMRVRRDFFVELTDVQFKKHFRFNKAGVERLTGLLEESLGNEPVSGMSLDNQVRFNFHH